MDSNAEKLTRFSSKVIVLFSSYVAHLPNTEGFLSLKSGTHTILPCYRCLEPMHSVSEAHVHKNEVSKPVVRS